MRYRFSKRPLALVAVQIALLVMMATQLFPLVWLGYSSLKPAQEIEANMLALPQRIDLSNYDPSVWTDLNVNLPIFFRNSLITTAITLILITAISVLAAYALAKMRLPGKNVIIVVLIILLGIPAHAIMIPIYYLLGDMGLLNNFLGLILVNVAAYSPFAVILLQAYFRDFPDEIIESATMDGSSRLRTLIWIVLPNNWGSIVSVLVISFLRVWNEYVFSLIILKDNDLKTLPVGISGFSGAWLTEWGPMFAGIFLALLPSIVFYAIFQRQIMKGMMGGSMKG